MKHGTDASLSQWTPTPVYFPVNALNPAMPERLPGGKVWLPSPSDGNRLDLGAGLNAYRYADGTGYTTAIWSKQGSGRVKLRLNSPKLAVFTTLDGTDPKVKLAKNGVEVTITEMPLLVSGTDEAPIPEPSWLDLVSRYEQLLGYELSLIHDNNEDSYYLRNALASFERNPGATFLDLYGRFRTANQRFGRFTWIEAERSPTTTFSERVGQSGCSGGAILALHTPVSTDSKGFYAEYTIPVRTGDEQDVWIAARLPSDLKSAVTLEIGDQRLTPDGDATGFYSTGFAWYHLGSTQLKGSNQKVILRVFAPEGADLAVDAILLCPGRFQPSGITMPDAIPYEALPVKKRR